VFVDYLSNPGLILSSSQDGFFKMWSLQLECVSSWNIHNPEAQGAPSDKWYFPFNWQGSKKEELRKTIEVLEHIGESKRDLDILEA
jgi:hypothetical protein